MVGGGRAITVELNFIPRTLQAVSAPSLTANFARRFPNGPEIAIDDLRLGGGVTVLFGASGSGKTTVLRCLAGLDRPDRGRIHFGETIWFDGSRNFVLPARARGIGFVPQEYALFPHLTVAGNVAYGLNHLPAAARAARVAETLRWLGLDDLEQRLPAALSGGQQQRVALARAVARRPQLLLLDEPFASLDTPARLRLRGELRQHLRQLAIPTVLVTHDRFEALALGDSVVVLHAGRNVQQGAVSEVFSRPTNLAVAEVTAVETIQPGRVLDIRDGLATVTVGGVQLSALAVAGLRPGGDVYVCIRAEDVVLMPTGSVPASSRNRLAVTVHSLEPEGPQVRVNLAGDFALTALLTRNACEDLALRPGASLLALIKTPQVHLIPFTR